jgi:hypothetical protein
MDPRLVMAEHILTAYHLQKGARTLFRKLTDAWKLFSELLTLPSLLISEIERVVPKLVFISALLIAVFLPILSVAGAGRTSIKPGWRFAR